MKTKIHAILRIAALAVTLILCLASCGEGGAVMRCGSSSISEREFRFYLATYKARFAQTYSDFRDNEAFYRQSVGDGTAEDVLFAEVVNNVSYSLLSDVLFREHGLSLPKSVVSDVDGYIESYLEDYADGNRNVLNKSLGEYGVNIKIFREILLRDERAYRLYDYLYGENGTVGVNDDDRQAYLEENYARVRHIYVNNAYVYETDAAGRPVYDDNGYQKQKPMEGEALQAKNELIAAIDEALASGEDFETVYEAASEDKYYKEGYYITRDMDFVEGVVRSAFDLEIGQWTKVESSVGVHYVMRLPLGEKPWADESCADFFPDYDEMVSSLLFTEMLDGMKDRIEYDLDLLSQYSVEASPTNTRFQ